MREEIDPSDISRAQFEAISPLLESVRKKTKPREVDLFEVGCALLTVLRGGIQGRRLPKDFPKWNTVYSYFVRGKNLGKQQVSVWEQVLRQEVDAARIQEGRPAMPSFLIVEAQSVKKPPTRPSAKATMRGKRDRASNVTLRSIASNRLWRSSHNGSCRTKSRNSSVPGSDRPKGTPSTTERTRPFISVKRTFRHWQLPHADPASQESPEAARPTRSEDS